MAGIKKLCQGCGHRTGRLTTGMYAICVTCKSVKRRGIVSMKAGEYEAVRVSCGKWVVTTRLGTMMTGLQPTRDAAIVEFAKGE